MPEQIKINKHSFNCEGYNPDSYFNFKMSINCAWEKIKQANLCLDNRTSAEQICSQKMQAIMEILDSITFED